MELLESVGPRPRQPRSLRFGRRIEILLPAIKFRCSCLVSQECYLRKIVVERDWHPFGLIAVRIKARRQNRRRTHLTLRPAHIQTELIDCEQQTLKRESLRIRNSEEESSGGRN